MKQIFFQQKLIGATVVALLCFNTIQAQNYTINTIAGNGTAGYSGDAGAATTAKLDNPAGVAVDAAGNLYIADYANNRIRKVNYSTGIITTIAGNGTAGFSGDGGAATAAELYSPISVALDTSGNVYISDHFNQRIRKINHTTGIITTIAGTGTAGYAGDGGAATAAELNRPSGISVNASGNLYIADSQNNYIRKIILSTGIITSVAGNGTAGYTGDGAAATTAEINGPNAVTTDASGNIYIADSQNNRIREVNHTTGIISTFAGDGIAGFFGDTGAATAAEIGSPGGIAIDASGNINFADLGNKRVRQINSSGIIKTIAGNGTAGFSGDGGAGTLAELNNPADLAVDASGDIYVADYSNNRIRKLTVPLGIENLSNNNAINVYPNPASTLLNVAVNIAQLKAGSICIYNTTGKKVRCETLTGNITSISIADLPSGMYYCRITDASGNLVKADKIVIVK